MRGWRISNDLEDQQFGELLPGAINETNRMGACRTDNWNQEGRMEGTSRNKWISGTDNVEPSKTETGDQSIKGLSIDFQSSRVRWTNGKPFVTEQNR
jgi:hypothetical protein